MPSVEQGKIVSEIAPSSQCLEEKDSPPGRRNRLAWLERTQILANLIVPLAFLITAVAYFEQTRENHRDATERQIELFHNEGLALAQSRLFSLWVDKNLSSLRDQRLPRKTIDSLVERTIRTSEISRADISAAIVSLALFFDRAEACMQSGRCDEDYMTNEIGRYGHDFYCTYLGEISRISNASLLSGMGSGLKLFAERTGSC